MAHTEVITRRCLPHWFVPGAAHFVTYRLFGTLPAEALDTLKCRKDELQAEKQTRPGETIADRRKRIHKQLFAAYDSFLDAGTEIRWLADPRVAALVRSNLYHHNGTRYRLLAYCIMPNHVHVLLLPTDEDDRGAGGPHARPDEQFGEALDAGSPLSSIMHSLKSYTAHEANKLLVRSGEFWQSESYDHWVRDEDEMARIVEYIALNPVKAGLVERPQDWWFCSAHDCYLTTGQVSAWLPWQ